jgi:putative ABC transport system permease protein
VVFTTARSRPPINRRFFHWSFLNETVKRQSPRRADQTGVFISLLRDPQQAAQVSQAIDATFKNSLAETLTETEKAFQLGFVAMAETILLAIEAVSLVVIVIIMAVMANTMAMTSREAQCRVCDVQGTGLQRRFVALISRNRSPSRSLAGFGSASG